MSEEEKIFLANANEWTPPFLRRGALFWVVMGGEGRSKRDF